MNEDADAALEKVERPVSQVAAMVIVVLWLSVAALAALGVMRMVRG